MGSRVARDGGGGLLQEAVSAAPACYSRQWLATRDGGSGGDLLQEAAAAATSPNFLYILILWAHHMINFFCYNCLVDLHQ
jgi:hypothetical protein